MRPVRREPEIGEEVRVPGGHHCVQGEEPGGPVVGVQAVPAPRVVAEHDVGSARSRMTAATSRRLA